MKLTIAPKDILAALKAGIHGKSESPISEYALINANNAGVVRFTTHHVGRQYWIEVEAEVAADGDIAVPVNGLVSVLSAKGDAVTLESTAHGLVVEQGKASFTIPCLPGTDFPTDTIDTTEQVPINPVAMQTALSRVRAATNPDDVRPFARVIRFEKGYAVATNGHLISVAKIDYDGPEFHVDARNAELVLRCLSEASQVLIGKIEQANNRLIIRNGPDQLSLPLIFLEYPGWQQIIPDMPDTFFEVDTDSWVTAIKRCAAAANLRDTNKQMAIALEPSKSAIDVTSIAGFVLSPDTGLDTVEVLQGSGPKKPADPIALNVNLLLGILQQYKGGKVRWYPTLGRDSIPNLFTVTDSPYQHYLMQVRLPTPKTKVAAK